jgi:hypothetical protein
MEIEFTDKDLKFTDRDLWNLDITLSKIIIQGLKQFKELKDPAYPVNDEIHNREEWEAKLDIMIKTFERICDDDISTEKDKFIDEGLTVFAKYFRALWT